MSAERRPEKAVLSLELMMPGPPKTWKPPRIGRSHSYPDPGNTANVRSWRSLWMAEGSLWVASPVILEVYVRVERPKTHLAKNGLPNAEGQRRRWPGGFDCSNVIKLVEDALKNHAFADDADIVAVHCSKRWVTKLEAGTFVSLTTAGAYDS